MRRTYPRYPAQRIASYHYGGKRYLTLTMDLGLGGMKIKTLDSLPKNEHLRFKLVLGANSIWPKGRIAYTRFLEDQEVVSGVEFMEFSDNDHALLRRYLDTLEDWPKPRPMVSSGATDA